MDKIEMQMRMHETSAKWLNSKASDLLNRYKKSKTEHGRKKLYSELVDIKNRIEFQCREISKVIGD